MDKIPILPLRSIEDGGWTYIGGQDMDVVEYDPVLEPYQVEVQKYICIMGDGYEHLTDMFRTAPDMAAEIESLRKANDKLLAACKDTAAWFSKFRTTHSLTFEGAPDLVDAVNAAIAKAKEI